MEIYNKLFYDKMPNQLYHYTTKEGFLGIIKNNELWASHILYQNDSSEYNFALNLLIETIEKNKNIFNKYDINKLIDNLKNYSNKNIYVASLSEEKDTLSQWRGYGKSIPSFSIGFHGHYLFRLHTTNKNIIFAKCIYEKEKQKTLILDLINASLELINVSIEKSYNIYKNHDTKLFYNIASMMMSYAPLIKHENFKEEKEWRIIIPYVSKEDINIRIAKTCFIPYYKIKFNLEKVFGDIIIGPCPDKILTFNSTLIACDKYGIEISQDFRKLLHSEIPFRNW